MFLKIGFPFLIFAKFVCGEGKYKVGNLTSQILCWLAWDAQAEFEY